MISDFLKALELKTAEFKRLEELNKTHDTAFKLKLDKCQKCAYCCKIRSCIPTPDELRKVAKFFKMSVKDLIKKYYCIDCMPNRSSVLFVKPAGLNQLDLVGKKIPDLRTYNEGNCVFLDENNLCKIHSIGIEHAKGLVCYSSSKESTEKVLKTWEGGKLEEMYDVEEEK